MHGDALLALLLTEVIEVSVALLLGFRSRREIAAVILVNLVTNPCLNYLLLLNRYLGLVPINLPIILALEAGVVLVEWGLLVYALHRNPMSLLRLSFAMNACSYLAGTLVFGWGV